MVALAAMASPAQSARLPLGGFASRLFATLVAERGPDSNTVVSPVSAGIALSLVRFGARGATGTALDKVLGMTGLDQKVIERRGAEMMSNLSRRRDVTLDVANAIWLDSTLTPTSNFRASTAQWNATTSALPLATERAVLAINHWAASVTNGKINTLLPAPLPESTRLFIANAVYFKGKWLEEFDKSETKPGDFTLRSGTRITVPRMSRVMEIGYRRIRGYRSIRLPYRGDKVAMYIVLPDMGASVDSIARSLGAGDWAPSGRTDVHRMHVVLPRFHAELAIDLNKPLVKLGAAIAFDCGLADFGGMATQNGPSTSMPLCVNKLLQRVYIDVDEEGTEAAAVTAVTVDTSVSTPPLEFIVDRPFFFVLRDETTGIDLFVGRIVHP